LDGVRLSLVPARLRQVRLLLIGLLTALTLFALSASDAWAKPKPSVSFSLAKRVMEGSPVTFTWSARHLGGGAHLVIQRPVGTSHTWKTMGRLPSLSGSGEIPGMTLGKYRYRVAAIKGRWLLAQQAAGTAVFGPVPFSTLFHNGGSGAYATPTSSFPYVAVYSADAVPAFTVKDNNCLSVHIGFVPGQHRGPGTGTLTLVQEARDPVSATVAYDAIGSIDAELTPGQTWGVNITYETSTPANWEPETYVNGYAVCNSAEPIISY
jgi:hypothetical protein